MAFQHLAGRNLMLDYVHSCIICSPNICVQYLEVKELGVFFKTPLFLVLTLNEMMYPLVQYMTCPVIRIRQRVSLDAILPFSA